MLALLVTLCLNRSGIGFFAPLIAAYGLTFLFLKSGAPKRLGAQSVTVALVGLLALGALWPDRSPVPRSEMVNVRWTAGLSDATRASLEERFALDEGEPTQDYSEEVNVWIYRLHDLSRENVEALVTHPEVFDTHNIDRPEFRVPPQPPAMDYPFLGVELVQWLQYPSLLLSIGTTILVWAMAVVIPAASTSVRGRRILDALEAPLREPFYRHALPFVLCVTVFALWSARLSLSPLPLTPGRAQAASTPRAMIEQMPCVTTPRAPARYTEELLAGEALMLPERITCPPDYGVIEWVNAHVPTSAILAINVWNPIPSSLFMPQQVVAFPSVDLAFGYQKELFADYYKIYDERIRRYRDQPFFNVVETPEERSAFVQALGVTHVLVDPAYYDEMRTVLDGLPQQFELRYANAGWAVYETI